ncbi:nfrkb [Culex quinquefasciatus]|uniref:Nfrkb n=1 Tax=Culex quinquefasciatus TaxID=7176 RepID=B0XET8_CULQU|nr:nfrkb [Culex quinquefasciatus]|eukprot:XP_001868160.1 nfrkb [Culex quinquefasciatus]
MGGRRLTSQQLQQLQQQHQQQQQQHFKQQQFQQQQQHQYHQQQHQQSQQAMLFHQQHHQQHQQSQQAPPSLMGPPPTNPLHRSAPRFHGASRHRKDSLGKSGGKYMYPGGGGGGGIPGSPTMGFAENIYHPQTGHGGMVHNSSANSVNSLAGNGKHMGIGRYPEPDPDVIEVYLEDDPVKLKEAVREGKEKATQDEIALFRSQEKIRYENPHMAFTFKHPAYTSVVGPVKGIYTQVPGITKARGHNMLVADRPNFVTILALVRDATARLPNGEGTRADICELLKSSQYISQSAIENPQVLQTIVSGALDRMHTELDPCVKYDTKRKIWIYLHRNRTEQEFEMLHHQYQGIAKHKKTICRKSKSKDSDVTTPEKESSPSTSTAISVPPERDLSDTSLSSENSSQPKPPPSTSSSSSSSMVIQMTNSAAMRPSFQIKSLPLQSETSQKHIVGRSVVQMTMKSAIFNELDRQGAKE